MQMGLQLVEQFNLSKFPFSKYKNILINVIIVM